MGFVFALLGYLSVVVAVIVMFVLSINFILAEPPRTAMTKAAGGAKTVNASKSSSRRSPRDITRKLADHAANGLH
jgi:hypothetical protein